MYNFYKITKLINKELDNLQGKILNSENLYNRESILNNGIHLIYFIYMLSLFKGLANMICFLKTFLNVLNQIIPIIKIFNKFF